MAKHYLKLYLCISPFKQLHLTPQPLIFLCCNTSVEKKALLADKITICRVSVQLNQLIPVFPTYTLELLYFYFRIQ